MTFFYAKSVVKVYNRIMSENNVELDAINHLLEIEKKASTLIYEAQTEVDKRMADAQSKYNGEYKEKFDKLTEELESEYQQKINEITEQNQNEINEYKKSLAEKSQNTKAFNSLLEKLLLG